MSGVIDIAFYQPDIPANVGAAARMCAVFGLDLHIIEPAGFPWSHAAFRRAGMDYLDHVTIVRHDSWARFLEAMAGRRLVLATTKGAVFHHQFRFAEGDVLLFGRESAGVPEDVHETADARVKIPMRPGLRSLNVAMSAGIMAAEALRQLQAFPAESP